MKYLIACGLMTLVLTASAAGPEKVATIDRNLWPEALSDNDAFNRASEAEIRVFAQQLNETALSAKADIQAFTGIENVNVAGVEKWLIATRQQLVKNYRLACGCDVSSWQDLLAYDDSFTSGKYQAWKLASIKFHRYYLYEQVRLAALFPRITSEIDLLDEKNEINGSEMGDLQFLLSFDDGPSDNVKQKDGSYENRTLNLVKDLNSDNLHAQFFILGSRLKTLRPDMDTYKGQCLGSHGFEHKSHQKWDDWQSSLQQTRETLGQYQKGPYWLRPPYGQRHQDLINDLSAHKEKVMLWNIDSQDWNRKLTNDQVRNRVVTLMLLWRHGIILYHDIHERAVNNLPTLNQLQNKTNVNFIDCRRFTPDSL